MNSNVFVLLLLSYTLLKSEFEKANPVHHIIEYSQISRGMNGLSTTTRKSVGNCCSLDYLSLFLW